MAQSLKTICADYIVRDRKQCRSGRVDIDSIEFVKQRREYHREYLVRYSSENRFGSPKSFEREETVIGIDKLNSLIKSLEEKDFFGWYSFHSTKVTYGYPTRLLMVTTGKKMFLVYKNHKEVKRRVILKRAREDFLEHKKWPYIQKW